MKNKSNLFLVLLCIAIALIFALIDYYSTPRTFLPNKTIVKYSGILFSYEVTRYPVLAEITFLNLNESQITLGLGNEPGRLNFGIIPTGGHYATRHLAIVNSESNKVHVVFKVYGEIKPMVKISDENFVLSSGESKTVDISVKTSPETIPGNYTGEIDIIVKKPNFALLNFFM